MLNCNNWEGRWRERGAGNGAWGASVMGCRIESPCASWLVLPGGEEGLGDVHLQKPSLPTGLLQAKRRGKGLGVEWSSHCDVKITGGASQSSCYDRSLHQVWSQSSWLSLQPLAQALHWAPVKWGQPRPSGVPTSGNNGFLLTV